MIKKKTGFFEEDEITSQAQPKPSEDAKDLALLLASGLARKRKVFRPPLLPRWSKDLDLLLNHFTSTELKEMIEWYVDHIDVAYMPQAYSAATFVDKFAAIRRAFESRSSVEASEESALEAKESRIMEKKAALRQKLLDQGITVK